MTDGLKKAARRGVDWLRRYALPLWATEGFFAGPDYFREALDFDGRPVEAIDTRSRVQGRQMYVYGHAAALGWHDGREVLSRCYERGYAAFLHPDGGYMGAIRPDGTPADQRRYAYEQAFALLGFAWHAKIFPHGGAAARAAALWEWLVARLAMPEGFAMAVPPEAGPRSQNPHMHLFEACLNWRRNSGNGAEWVARAAALRDLFDRKFFDRERGVLREFFADDLTPTAPQSNRIDPGHQAEWIWLLHWHQTIAGAPAGDAPEALWRFAEKHGRNPATGLLYEEVDIDGRVLKDTSRLWSATELLKAEIARYEAGGRRGPTKGIEEAVDLIFRRHIEGARPGLWIDKVDAAGNPAAANAPASTLYHLFLAFAELDRVAA